MSDWAGRWPRIPRRVVSLTAKLSFDGRDRRFRPCRKESAFSRRIHHRHCVFSSRYSSIPQNPSGGFVSCRPNSHPCRPSCPRQISTAAETLLLSRFTTRIFWPTVNPCGTMARQPFALTSTVKPSVCNARPSSVHSTARFTREFIRETARVYFMRSSKFSVSRNGTVFSCPKFSHAVLAHFEPRFALRQGQWNFPRNSLHQ